MGCGCNKKSVTLAKKFVMAKKKYKIADKFLNREWFIFMNNKFYTKQLMDDQQLMANLVNMGLKNVIVEIEEEVIKPKKIKKQNADKEKKED